MLTAGRSNYVKIKDHAGLSKSLSLFPHLSLESGKDGKHCILAEYNNPINQSGYNDGLEIEFYPQIHIMPFLEDNEIFIIMEVQNDKLYWVYGYVEAYQGNKKISFNLYDIYNMIEKEWKTDDYTTVDH